MSCSKVDPNCEKNGKCEPVFHPLNLRIENVTDQDFSSIIVHGMYDYEYGSLAPVILLTTNSGKKEPTGMLGLKLLLPPTILLNLRHFVTPVRFP
ncbi:MAG: hypothetical protein DCO96_12370 [Fluviicola sp. XM-24bin1]|nr:MAG: hypothetical protein DCO96_12370 [Fluviicola sp. XM-24bin1]